MALLKMTKASLHIFYKLGAHVHVLTILVRSSLNHKENHVIHGNEGQNATKSRMMATTI